MSTDVEFMRRAIELARQGVEGNVGGPFGCVIAKDGRLIAEGVNAVSSTNDPTAHAEIVAIRRACEKLDSFRLEGCLIYATCEPCPMCLGAIYWSRAERLYIACDRNDAAAAGFDDAHIYEELCSTELGNRKIPVSILLRADGLAVFDDWERKPDKIEY
ncbi:MAG: nucleoside deaminase [Chloracidobacterium sp.]|nr:nucleoside deaminase [Chloracidobacterium sp.]